MEEIARTVALKLSLFVEVLGALIIGIALIQFVIGRQKDGKWAYEDFWKFTRVK